VKTVSSEGLNLIRRFESLRLEAYQDEAGVWTIGYGHTGLDVKPGMRITQEQAEELFRQDINRFEAGLRSLLTREPTQSQWDALVSWAFNVGLEAARRSTLLRLFNIGDIEGAARQFGEWVLVGGRVSRGLVRRRVAEIVLFLRPAGGLS